MSHALLIISANLMQIAVPFLTMVAYVPQWVRLIKTKSSEDFCLFSWVLWALASGFGMYYAVIQLLVNGHGWPLVLSAVLSFLFMIVTMVLVAYFKYYKKLMSSVSAAIAALPNDDVIIPSLTSAMEQE